jgi:hypothetical protein
VRRLFLEEGTALDISNFGGLVVIRSFDDLAVSPASTTTLSLNHTC